jgi:hypothetical protein
VSVDISDAGSIITTSGQVLELSLPGGTIVTILETLDLITKYDVAGSISNAELRKHFNHNQILVPQLLVMVSRSADTGNTLAIGTGLSLEQVSI